MESNFLNDNRIPKTLLALNAALAIFYFVILAFFFQRGNEILFWLLISGEVFHLWQALTFLNTIWETEYEAYRDESFKPSVDVFITVAGEPAEIVRETVEAALRMKYPDFKIFILNDGYVAKKSNWREIENLADNLGVNCITRKKSGGAKAGNINNALRITEGSFVVVFDSDHVPDEEFLSETIPYFADEKLAFIQTPQFYKNNDANEIAAGAWEQQALFFGPICKGKNRSNSATMCGTNMIARREALEEVGGMNESSIAEDFITGFALHKNGWKSLYVPKILARGLAPEDFLSYSKQQSRWARGSLDLVFRHNLLFTKGLKFAQRIEYLSSASFFLSGWVVLIDAAIPVVFLFTGWFPIRTSTMTLAAIFIPYMFLMLYTIQVASNFSFSYRALAFSISGWNTHVSATLSSLFHVKSLFSITSKTAQNGNFIYLAIPQIAYCIVAIIGFFYALADGRGAAMPALVANLAWALIYGVIFLEYVKAAAPRPALQKSAERAPAPQT